MKENANQPNQTIRQNVTFGELRKILPNPRSSAKPPITQLREKATVILQKNMDCCELEVFDNGFWVCTEKGRSKVYSINVCFVLKDALLNSQPVFLQDMSIDELPWWTPMEMIGMDRLYCIYDKATGLWFGVKASEFAEYNRFRSRVRFKEMYHKRCECPRNKWWLCDGMCHDCEFHISEGHESIDTARAAEDKDEPRLVDQLASSQNDPGETIPEKMLTHQLLNRLSELMPEASEIGRLRLLGMSDDAIAEAIGINRMTFRTRIESARKILREEFGKEFDF